ncbi:D-aminoacyl-tRNA deacylase [Oceanithermus sp.]
MRALIQRVKQAQVEVNGETTGFIRKGLLIFFAAATGDTAEDLEYLCRKVVNLRIFSDESGKMNLSVRDVSGEILVVSQFTLYASTRKGNRPSFTAAADPAEGKMWYGLCLDKLAELGIHTEAGVFGAHMLVSLVNDGPVTIILDSRDRLRSRRG